MLVLLLSGNITYNHLNKINTKTNDLNIKIRHKIKFLLGVQVQFIF